MKETKDKKWQYALMVDSEFDDAVERIRKNMYLLSKAQAIRYAVRFYASVLDGDTLVGSDIRGKK